MQPGPTCIPPTKRIAPAKPKKGRSARSVSLAEYRLRSEEHTSELQSPCNLVCRLLLEKKQMRRRRVSQQLQYPDIQPSLSRRARADLQLWRLGLAPPLSALITAFWTTNAPTHSIYPPN